VLSREGKDTALSKKEANPPNFDSRTNLQKKAEGAKLLPVPPRLRDGLTLAKRQNVSRVKGKAVKRSPTSSRVNTAFLKALGKKKKKYRPVWGRGGK